MNERVKADTLISILTHVVAVLLTAIITLLMATSGKVGESQVHAIVSTTQAPILQSISTSLSELKAQLGQQSMDMTILKSQVAALKQAMADAGHRIDGADPLGAR